MVTIGTPFSKNSTKVLLCGSGELGKELAIEFQKYGVEIIAIDRYNNAPAMQVSHKKYVIDMLDEKKLQKIICYEKPNYIIPEIEAFNIDVLIKCEKYGFKVIPTAKAIKYSMNRETIRNLVSLKLKLKTSKYKIVQSKKELIREINEIGYPCISKPIMSSSGKGQTFIESINQIDNAWENANNNSRVNSKKIIIEEYINFDYEITLLTIKSKNKTIFCNPIGHEQINGDYKISWQPHKMNKNILNKAKQNAKLITDYIGGEGIFGVEFFVKNDILYFNEISPRPHDTGFVTLLSQNYSEFELHVRAILGFPINKIIQNGPTASLALIGNNETSNILNENIYYQNIEQILESNCELRLFGKPNIKKKRRLGIILARSKTIEQAIKKCKNAEKKIKIIIK